MTKYIRLNTDDGKPYMVIPVDKIDLIAPTDGYLYVNGTKNRFENKKLVEDICEEYMKICDDDDKEKEGKR